MNILEFKQDISLEVKDLIKSLKLESSFTFKKFTTDLNKIYLNQDILCFLSSFDSPGRPIFEAAFYKVPSLASISKPMNDTFINNETGIKVDASSPRDIAKNITRGIYLYGYTK